MTTHYVYARGQGLPSVFRWKTPDGSSVIAHRCFNGYGHSPFTTKEQFFSLIHKHLEQGEKRQTFFWGLGDHGGGVYRKHLEWIQEAAETLPIQFSTLTEYFNDLAADGIDLPEFEGEIAGNSRAIYSSCRTVKRQAAQAFRRLLKAERLGAPPELLEVPWRELAFNHFHDIMPGTSIRQTFEEDVYPSLGYSDFVAQSFINEELTKRETASDLNFVTEGGMQIWNPHPREITAIVGIDGFCDPNAVGTVFQSLKGKDGESIPLQILPSNSGYGPYCAPWGKLTAAIKLPPLSNRYVAYSREKTEQPAIGFEKLRRVLESITFAVFYDNNGVWGFSMTPYYSTADFAELKEVYEVANGPVCAVLAAEYVFRNSEIRVELTHYHDIPQIKLNVTACWNEKNTCLKMAVDFHSSITTFVTGNPGGVTVRGTSAGTDSNLWKENGKKLREPNTPECAFNDFLAAENAERFVAIFSSDLYSCDCSDGCLRLTLLRPARYADFIEMPCPKSEGWMDLGYSYFTIWMLYENRGSFSELPQMAEPLLLPPEVREITGHPAGRDRSNKTVPPFDCRSADCLVTSISAKQVMVWNPTAKEECVTVDQTNYRLPPFSIRRIIRGSAHNEK